ncbi:DUF3995 domain-containing protein [Demequina activiva]|uniref:Uncharacterized protein n=1 Tax=Demequina activiva TaxID=1582364 RepID=A0A919Q265_9MICO|nr:DUF3995 domain-containing protein [Demequina activiva]GIG54847.1 hypothetical protein Dac01nite_15990 [Demequina activiva]
MAAWAAAIILVGIGIAHSALGEAQILRPLLASRTWSIPAIPRGAIDRLLRFAWHLTTLAWWALAATLVGVPVAVTFAATCLSAAAIILAVLPGHLAWPGFLAAGLLALGSAGMLPAWLLGSVVAVAVVVALVAAGFHVAWTLGSRRGVANVVPQRSDGGERTFVPGPVPTVGVAVLLTVYAILVLLSASGEPAGWARWLLIAALVVLSLRVIGDGRWMGVTKRVRDTGFARADDRWWTPAAALLATGAAAALALG